MNTGIWIKSRFMGSDPILVVQPCFVQGLVLIKGISCDFFILTLEQIIVLNKYGIYNNHISKHSRTCLKSGKMRYKNNNKKVRNKLLKVNSLYFKRRL